MLKVPFTKILLQLQLIVVIVSAHSTTQHTYSKRILNGKEASISQYPHQVSLRSTENNRYFCGGAILSERWILTAAQCTQGSESIPKNVYIVVGSSNLTSGGLRYNIEKIVNHPHFNWTKRENDISMLKTDRPLRILDGAIFPIDFPSFKTNYLIENGIGVTSVILSGWGIFQLPESSGEEPMQSNMLRSQESYILARNSCRRHLGHVKGKLLSEDHLCTGVRIGEGMCNDVGSPLITKTGEIVGIASWQGSHCGSGHPDVYTRVFQHRDWIWNNLINSIPA